MSFLSEGSATQKYTSRYMYISVDDDYEDCNRSSPHRSEMCLKCTRRFYLSDVIATSWNCAREFNLGAANATLWKCPRRPKLSTVGITSWKLLNLRQCRRRESEVECKADSE